MDTFLISIEGSDGAGNATQSALLKEWFLFLGLTVTTVSFPRYRDTWAGKMLWDFMKGPVAHTHQFSQCSPYEASTYYAEDRRESLSYLRNLISQHAVVIFDRYVESNLIHQGGKLGTNGELNDFAQWIFNLEYKQHKLPQPGVIFYLDLPLDVALERVKGQAKERGEQPDAVEFDTAYIRNSHHAGLFYAEKLGWYMIPCVTTDGKERDVSEIQNHIRGVLTRKYNL